MSPLVIISMLTPLLGTLNLVLGLIAVIPGASTAAAPIQAAIGSITNAIGILNGLPGA